MRLFIGIPVGVDTSEALQVIVKDLKPRLPGLRWSDPAGWHITLQFLGSADQTHYDCLVSVLQRVPFQPFAIELSELGTFDRAGVLFVDVRLSDELQSLQQRIVEATAACGFKAEDRPYHPHITLARGRVKPSGRAALEKPVSIPAYVADAFCLYESVPTPSGSRYEVRARFE